MNLTPEILTKICPSIKGQRAVTISALFNEICPQYGINTPDIFHEFIANVLVESWELGKFTENLNYSTESLIKKFGRHRITVDQARRYGRNAEHPADQKTLANILYGGEFGRKNLGNTQPNDGWNLRGSGPMQATGRFIIQGFTDYFNKRFGTFHSVHEMAILLREDLRIGIHNSCWIFAVVKGLLDEAQKDMVKTIRKAINGGLFGFDEVEGYYERAVKYFT